VSHADSNARLHCTDTLRPETYKLTSKMRWLHLNHRIICRMAIIHLPSVLLSLILGSVGSKSRLAKLTPEAT
jgi:hypothetical protein